VASTADAERIRGACRRVPVIVYPNALPWIDRPARADDNAIIFTGNMEYAPNANGAAWFAQTVWPRLRGACPELVWRIAGKGADRLRGLALSDARVEFIASFEDAVAEIARARAAVVPILAGSGTRFKILEAWAAATPVVSTALGAEGLSAEHGKNILIAGSPAEMQETIVGLLASQCQRQTIGGGGRALYEERFTWTQAWRALGGMHLEC
jgi:glycosyltransferase involved in cell wall biosynthesis